RFPYFSKILLAPHTGAETPLTSVQIANRYGVNPSFLDQVVDYLQRSNGAAASVLYAWETFGSDAPRNAWTSPAARLFLGNTDQTAEALAAHYETLFKQALKEGKTASDTGLKALYEFLMEKFGPFRAPGNARRYYPAAVREQLVKL